MGPKELNYAIFHHFLNNQTKAKLTWPHPPQHNDTYKKALKTRNIDGFRRPGCRYYCLHNTHSTAANRRSSTSSACKALWKNTQRRERGKGKGEGGDYRPKRGVSSVRWWRRQNVNRFHWGGRERRMVGMRGKKNKIKRVILKNH